MALVFIQHLLTYLTFDVDITKMLLATSAQNESFCALVTKTSVSLFLISASHWNRMGIYVDKTPARLLRYTGCLFFNSNFFLPLWGWSYQPAVNRDFYVER